MQHLLGSTQILLIAALVLVLVASLPALPALTGEDAWLALPAFLGTLLAGSAAIWQGFEHSRVAIDSLPGRVMRYAVAGLSRAEAPNVVVIDGGSFVLNGVDAPSVEKELARLGYEASVVRLAMSGANHFERYRLQQTIVQRLSRARQKGQHWVYLAEVHAGYDRSPLDQFGGNQDTSRAYQYTTLGNSWNALRALESPGVKQPLGGEYAWPLLRHTLVNAFNVGAGERYVPEDAVEMGAGRAFDAKPIRKFRGLGALIKLAKKSKVPPKMLPWLKDVRDPRTRRLWRRYLTHFVYFGVPSTQSFQLSYVKSFCAATEQPCISPDAELLADLDDRKYWRNAGHMRVPGAMIYSRWLAQRLAEAGVLKK